LVARANSSTVLGASATRYRDPQLCSDGDRPRSYETDYQLIHPHSVRELGRLRNLIGQRVKADRFTPKVLKLVGDGQSYREISHRLGLSKNTVLDIIKRDRAA
jgi:hypothetical protein